MRQAALGKRTKQMGTSKRSGEAPRWNPRCGNWGKFYVDSVHISPSACTNISGGSKTQFCPLLLRWYIRAACSRHFLLFVTTESWSISHYCELQTLYRNWIEFHFVSCKTNTQHFFPMLIWFDLYLSQTSTSKAANKCNKKKQKKMIKCKLHFYISTYITNK